MRAPARRGFSALGAGGKEGSLPANRAARRRAHPSRVVTPASLSLSSAIALPPSKRRAGSWGRQRPRARLDRPLGLWGARVGRVGVGVSGEGGWSVSDDRGSRASLSLSRSLSRARVHPPPSLRHEATRLCATRRPVPIPGGEGKALGGTGRAKRTGGGESRYRGCFPLPLLLQASSPRASVRHADPDRRPARDGAPHQTRRSTASRGLRGNPARCLTSRGSRTRWIVFLARGSPPLLASLSLHARNERGRLLALCSPSHVGPTGVR